MCSLFKLSSKAIIFTLLLIALESFVVYIGHVHVLVSATWFSDLIALTQSSYFTARPTDRQTDHVVKEHMRLSKWQSRSSHPSRKSVRETSDNYRHHLQGLNVYDTTRSPSASITTAPTPVLPQTQRGNLLAQEIAICHALAGLTTAQRHICLRHSGLIWAMLEGTQLGMHECIHQFQHEQWNCSAVNLLYNMQSDTTAVPTVSGLEGILQRGSRETAFLSSAWSAGVVQAITRACSQGQMGTCDCDPHRREGQGQDTEGVFTWGGCSDPIKFGMRLTRLFLDANDEELWKMAARREEELHGPKQRRYVSPSSRKSSQLRAATHWKLRHGRAIADWTNQSYMNVEARGLQQTPSTARTAKAHKLTPLQVQIETLRLMQTKARSLMNLHNRRAGRRLVWVSRVRKCKCHGVSGACSMRTCWQRMNEFRRVGTLLKAAYDEALRVTFDPRHDSLRLITSRPLKYHDPNPWYQDGRATNGFYNQLVSQKKFPIRGKEKCRF